MLFLYDNRFSDTKEKLRSQVIFPITERAPVYTFLLKAADDKNSRVAGSFAKNYIVEVNKIDFTIKNNREMLYDKVFSIRKKAIYVATCLNAIIVQVLQKERNN
jgi:hypothetical protein